MKKSWIKLSAVAVAACASVAISIRSNADDQKKNAMPSQADMEAWAKMNAPGEQHAKLKTMAGHFMAESTIKMSADAEEMTSKGEEKSEMVLGDRFLQTEYTGDMMGMPFHGMGLTGYDNMKKKWVMTWVDDMTTGIMSTEGTSDEAGKVVTYTGEMLCPQDGSMKSYRNVFTFVDQDHYQMEMFQKGPDDKEFRGLLIKYSRVN